MCGSSCLKTSSYVWKIALGLAIAAAELAPVWTVPYPALMDYPNHLASAFVLMHLHDSAYHFAQYYVADWNTYPYLAMDLILLGLMRIFPIDVAGRLLLSLTVLSVPVGAWYFLRRANPGEASLAFWPLLVSINLYFFLYGFLNLQLSLAVCFLLLGLWLRHLERPRRATYGLLLSVTTMLYFTHLAGFAIAAVVMTAYAGSVRRPIKDRVSAWALYVPGVLFYLHALAGHGSRGAWQSRPLADKVRGLVAVVVGCSTAVDVLTLLLLLGCLAWARIDNRDFQWNRPWLRATVILFVFYWLLPAAFGPATNVDKRLLPFVFVLSLAGAKVGRRGRRLALIAVLLFFLRAGALEWHFVSLRPHLAKLAGAMTAIPPGARILSLVDWSGGAPLPERHFWAYGVIARGWVSPCLFHDPGVHPLRLRIPTYDPCSQLLTAASRVEWQRVQGDFDYIWAYRAPRFSPLLSSQGRVVYEAEGLQVLQLENHTLP